MRALRLVVAGMIAIAAMVVVMFAAGARRNRRAGIYPHESIHPPLLLQLQ